MNQPKSVSSAIVEGLEAGGVRSITMPLGVFHRSDVATEILTAGALCVGSPTINGSLFPTVADVLTYLRGLKRPNLIGAAFGSYGWANKAVPAIEEYFESMNIELAAESIKVKYVPTDDDLKNCYDSGVKIAEKLREKLTKE